MERICDDLQLEESVDDLLHQLGADEQGHISYAQFLLSHKYLQLTPVYQDPVDTMAEEPIENKVCRRRDPKNGED